LWRYTGVDRDFFRVAFEQLEIVVGKFDAQQNTASFLRLVAAAYQHRAFADSISFW